MFKADYFGVEVGSEVIPMKVCEFNSDGFQIYFLNILKTTSTHVKHVDLQL